jgi:hypothetical protein
VDLTICLVTKGRIEYLDPLLESLEGVFQFEWVKVLVVLNGVEKDVSDRITQWADMRENLIIERLEKNDPRPSIWWPLVRKHTDGWCVFISDDDLFHFEILPQWKSKIQASGDLVGISTLAQVIDLNGSKTGEIKKSLISVSPKRAHAVALSLNQPPFPWPTLFFNISKLPSDIPNSRYVFDWWVGIQLLLKGQVGYLDEISISYRSHPLQESFLATHKRKYFEAFIWFEILLESEIFKEWIKKLSDQEVKEFWKFCLESAPIYGDPVYSNIILNKLRLLLSNISDGVRESQLLADFALANGVLLKNQEIGTLLPEFSNDYATDSNIRVNFLAGSCGNTEAISYLFSPTSLRTYLVGCSHSKEKPLGATIVGCSTLLSGSPEIVADLILIAISDHLEKSGSMNLTITPKEKKLLLSVRKLRTRLPNPILNFLRKTLS